MLSQKRKLDYKWVILGVCFLMVFVCLGFCSSNKALYLTAITKALGIKRSLFSINDTFRFAASAVINLFFGSLLYRFGVRKMTAFGFATLIVSMLIYAFAESIGVFYIGGALLGVGLSFTSTTMASSIVRRWFKKDIGKYTGIVFAANGIGSALATQIASPLINAPGEPFGYRTSYLVVVGVLAVTAIIVVGLLRERPKGEIITAANLPKAQRRKGDWDGISYADAKKKPFFYVAAVSVLMTGMILQGITGVYAAHMEDAGLKAEFIALIVSAFSLMLTVSKVLVGALYDKKGLRWVMIVCQGAAVVAFFAMVLMDASALGAVLAVVFALCCALALPLETLVVPLIVNDLFGVASYDKILGIFVALNYTGYALGSPVMNLCYDAFGSYRPILLAFSLLMIPICAVFQFAITGARKEKRSVSCD